MSSCISSGGSIADAVVLPAMAVYGLAWTAGIVAVTAVEFTLATALMVKAECERRKEEEEALRREKLEAALAGREQLKKLCCQVLDELDAMPPSLGTEELRQSLAGIRDRPLPDQDYEQIQCRNSQDHMVLEQVLRRRDQLRRIRIPETGQILAEVMDALGAAFASASVEAIRGQYVRADPAALERADLNRRLHHAAGKVTDAIKVLSGLSSGRNGAWLLESLGRTAETLKALDRPDASNEAVEHGIRRSETLLKQFETLLPSICAETDQLNALYPLYRQACLALGEPVLSQSRFPSVRALEKKMQALKIRAEQAERCGELYRRLGREGYIRHAWDTELQKLGYQVTPRREDSGGSYNISAACGLEVLVHEDGTVSMEAVAKAPGAAAAVETHCSQLKALHENLRKNWFILYDYQEDAPAALHAAEEQRADLAAAPGVVRRRAL